MHASHVWNVRFPRFLVFRRFLPPCVGALFVRVLPLCSARRTYGRQRRKIEFWVLLKERRGKRSFEKGAAEQ